MTRLPSQCRLCRSGLAWLASALTWFVLPGAALLAQPPDSTAPPTQVADPAASTPVASSPAASLPATELLQPAGPDTTILVDDNGVPRPVVGMNYDEILKAWRVLEGLEPASNTPRFTRDAIEATGLLNGDRADLRVRFEVGLPAGGYQAVPLGFAGAVLNGDPTITPAAASKPPEDPLSNSGETQPGRKSQREYITYDDKRGGFVAWLDGMPGARRVVELPLLLPLNRDSRRVLLRTNIPRSTRATLTLTSPTPVIDPFVSDGALLDSTSTEAGDTLTVRGAVGDFQLAWQAPVATQVVQQQQTVLSVEGRVFCDIDGRRVRSRATLNVQSYGGDLERFRVRLPAGSTFIPGANPENGKDQPRITQLATDAEADGEKRPVCLVTLPQRTSAPVTVTIEIEQAIGLGEDSEIDLAGFDVIDAVRQDGQVALRVAEDWRLRWGELRVAQRVDVASLNEELQRPGVTAAVKYYGQPWKLAVRVMRLGTRFEAIPRYRLEIKPDSATLTTRVDYRIPGARLSSFSVDLQDWNRLTPTPPVGPLELVDSSQVTQNEDELYIPLLRPTSQQARIEFTAIQDLSPRDELLSFRLPIARATTQGVSELIVVVDPAVQLIPDMEKSRRLRSEPLPENFRDEADPTGVRTFRFVGFLPDQLFVAQKRLRVGEVEVALDSRLDLDTSGASVEQTFDYVARYEPVTQIRVTAPTDLVESNALEFELVPIAEPASLAASVSTVPSLPLIYQPGVPPEPDDSRCEVVVDLPRPWIGPFRVRGRYRVDGGLRELDFAGVVSAPLLMPLDDPQTSHRLRVQAESGGPLTLAPSRGGWTPIDSTDSPGVLVARATGLAERVWLTSLREAASTANRAVLRRVWRQTWIRQDAVQHRAAFAFDSSDKTATLMLPDSLGEVPLEVYLNGEALAELPRTKSRVTVPLDDESVKAVGNAVSHVLELRYLEQVSESSDRVGWEPVRFEANAAMAEGYWQVILPSDRQAVAPPVGFAAAMHREDNWNLKPVLSTEELEGWVGAMARNRPVAGERSYLYSYFGPASVDNTNALRLVSRNFVVFGCSAVALAIGLALIYLPRLRHPASLFTLAVGAVGAGVAYPGAFAAAVQAGAIGLLLVGVAALLAMVLRQPAAEDFGTGTSHQGPAVQGPGTDTMIALQMGTVSTNAPTVSLPPNDSRDTVL